jgi:hypothetical protein
MPPVPKTAPGPRSRPATARPIKANRLKAVLPHVAYYSIHGVTRLAEDCGVAPSTVSRLVRGANPSDALARAVVRSLSRRLRRRIALAEVFSADGSYPTPSACALLGCPGCLPPWAWDERTDRLKPAWKGGRGGDWSLAEPFPHPPVLQPA